MNSYYIYGEDVPPDIDRSLLINIFKPFGKLQKIYINPEKTWFKVYFESLEVAEAALSVSGQPPHRMQLSIKKENFVGKKSAAAKAPSVTESDSTMSYDDEELYGSIGSEYYNIHGVPVQTLLDDNGMIYVPLQEVKQIGFELFDDRNIPRVNFNKQMLSEFKLYLNIKARKYISRMRCNIPDNTVEKIKNEIINEYANSSTASSNVNISRQIDNNMNQSQTSNLKSSSSTGSYNSQKNNNRNYSGGPNKSGAQPEVQKSLRRPVTNAINDSPQSSTFVGGGRGVGGVTRNPNSRNDNATNRTNINNSVLNVEKENLNPRTQTGAVPKIKTNVINDGSVIKRVELPLNKSVQVIVSFIESQNICWVVRESDRDKLEKLLFETNLEATKQSSITPVVGQICAATYRGSWYRAIVQEVTPEVKVQFIDFGNFNDEKVTEVRNLPPKITAEPVQAVKLHFTSSPQTKLVDNVELKIIASKKNKDGSYQVEEVSEKKPEQTNRKTLNATPAGKLITTKSDPKTAKTEHANGPTEKLDIVSAQSKSRSSTPISTANNLDEQKKLAERLGSLTLKEKLRNMPHPKKEVTTPNPDRKCVSDLFEINATGTIEFTERLADDTCLVFALVASFLNEVTYLEEIKPGNQTAMDFAGKIGDTIAVYKEDSETWVRGTIINIKDGKYVVALIDYGKIITVAKVCQLEKRFHSIPEFVCLVSGTKECIDFLQAEQTADFTCNELSNLTISFNDVFYNMNCRRWDPFTTSNLVGTTTESPVFTTPPPLKEVKDGERILLVSLSDGKLFVRNKDTHELLTRINCLITAYAATPLAEAPVVNQLVLCPHESKTSLNRGVIKVVNAGYVDVDFIDLGFTDSVPLKKLMSINEELATEYCSLIPIALKDFEDGEFPDEAVEFLEQYCKEATKMITKKCSNNVFDLFTLNGSDMTSLSTKLTNLSAQKETPNTRVFYSDIPKWEMTPGQAATFLCINIEDNYITFIPHNDVNNDFIELNEIITKYTDTNTEPYSPILDELCLAKYEDEWYRAKIKSVNTALEEYDVYYIDYGNTATVPSMEIREMPKDFASKVPALAVLGYLTKQVKDEVAVGECYKVKIIRKMEEDNSYEIDIPELSKKLRNGLDY